MESSISHGSLDGSLQTAAISFVGEPSIHLAQEQQRSVPLEEKVITIDWYSGTCQRLVSQSLSSDGVSVPLCQKDSPARSYQRLQSISSSMTCIFATPAFKASSCISFVVSLRDVSKALDSRAVLAVPLFLDAFLRCRWLNRWKGTVQP
jgi:hypothetical protein